MTWEESWSFPLGDFRHKKRMNINIYCIIFSRSENYRQKHLSVQDYVAVFLSRALDRHENGEKEEDETYWIGEKEEERTKMFQ